MILQFQNNRNASIDQSHGIIPTGILTPLGYLVLYYSDSWVYIAGEGE